jgi:Cu-Zn family superoxide dismutase
MGNITIAENGSGAVEMVIPKVTLTDSKFTVGGRGVILHEKADDFGQPVGNAGGRIGCGVITITK